MANKNFKDYAIAGSNVTLTYDDNNDTVTFAAQGNVQSVNGKTGVVVIDKTDVSLGNVDNTSDINKPISTLVQNALNLKEGTITAGTTAQYYRGDKTFQTLDKTAVGLSNVDNTTDLLKPISTATQTALNGKQATISLTTTGSSGASTFAANVLNIPTYSLSGLGGQPLATNLTSISALTFASTSFVKMTAAGTFALDTNTYLTAESDTLASVTGRGNTTTNAITVGNLTANGSGLITGTTSSVVLSLQPFASSTANVFETRNTSGNVAYFINRFGGFQANDIAGIGGSTLGNCQFSIVNSGPISRVLLKVKAASGQTGNYQEWINSSDVALMTFTSNGNLLLNTTTDSGFKLDVNGTARIQNQLTTTGSITAASAIARGVYMNQTLVAGANGDVLFGLDINPTFTTGAFTGVAKVPFRAVLDSATTNIIQYNGTSNYAYFEITNNNTATGGFSSIQSRLQTRVNYLSIYNATDGGSIFGQLRGGWATNISENVSGMMIGTTTAADVIMGANNTATIRIFNSTRNVVIQNGGTFADAGFRLDVVGADSRFNGIRAGLGAGQVALNTCFGNNALNSNTTGTENVAIGYSALSNNTTGNFNVAIGYNQQSGNNGGVTMIGNSDSATGSNQMRFGSSRVPNGAVSTEINASSQVWNVFINGTARKILLA
jgi:hypothetical protein